MNKMNGMDGWMDGGERNKRQKIDGSKRDRERAQPIHCYLIRGHLLLQCHVMS